MRLSGRTAPVAAAILALGGAASASLSLAECLHDKAAALARIAACGDAGSVEYCLANRVPTDSQQCTHGVLADCFVNAGCTAEEARIEAAWIVRVCTMEDVDKAIEGELRRNAKGAGDDNNGNAAPLPIPAATAMVPLAATPIIELLKRAEASSSSSSSSSSSDSGTDDAASTFTVTAASSKLQCYTTTTVSTTMCPVQSTGANAGKSTLSCFPTVAQFPTCAAGLMCAVDNLGVVTCMHKQNSLDITGLVIAIVFASAILLSVGVMCFLCCRERREHKRIAKATEAAAIARQAVVNSKKANAAVRSVAASEAHAQQPLMPPVPPMPQQYAQPPMQQPYHHQLHHSESGPDLGGPNPFVDQHNLR